MCCTKARAIPGTVGVPIERMVINSSACKIARLCSTPACPNAASPARYSLTWHWMPTFWLCRPNIGAQDVRRLYISQRCTMVERMAPHHATKVMLEISVFKINGRQSF